MDVCLKRTTVENLQRRFEEGLDFRDLSRNELCTLGGIVGRYSVRSLPHYERRDALLAILDATKNVLISMRLRKAGPATTLLSASAIKDIPAAPKVLGDICVFLMQQEIEQRKCLGKDELERESLENEVLKSLDPACAYVLADDRREEIAYSVKDGEITYKYWSEF